MGFKENKGCKIVSFTICVFTALVTVVVVLTKLLERIKYMAKSKLVKANEKIAEKITEGFQKIQDTVVGGYSNIESIVVDEYIKIEEKFIDLYLTKDGETIEQAKKRLKQEQDKLKEKNH